MITGVAMADPRANRPTMSGVPSLVRTARMPHRQAAYTALPRNVHEKLRRRDGRLVGHDSPVPAAPGSLGGFSAAEPV